MLKSQTRKEGNQRLAIAGILSALELEELRQKTASSGPEASTAWVGPGATQRQRVGLPTRDQSHQGERLSGLCREYSHYPKEKEGKKYSGFFSLPTLNLPLVPPVGQT